MGVAEEAERLEGLELGAQLADSDDAGDGGGEAGGGDEVFEVALGVLDDEADGGGGYIVNGVGEGTARKMLVG